MSKMDPNTRRSSTSTYTKNWKKSVQRGGGMGNAKMHHYSHDEAGRRESDFAYPPTPRKRGFLRSLFGCTCFEFDESSDPVARYRSQHEAMHGRSPPEAIPPYSHHDPNPITFPILPNPDYRMSTASMATTSSQDSANLPPVQSHLLFLPKPAGFQDETSREYAAPNGSFAGGMTGGSGAGGG